MRKEFSARMVILTLAVMLGTLCANAQSTVYVFMRSAVNAECTITINGGSEIDIRGPFKKFQSVPGGDPLSHYYPAVKKFILKDAGATSFAVKYVYHVPSVAGGGDKIMNADIKLNLANGSVHYLKIGAKGLSGIQIKEINEKEGQKLLKDDKNKPLPDYNDDADL